jgi:hydroxyethylthiazole kinase-like uncharacterized protein yjeF
MDILTVSEMKRADEKTISSGTAGFALMRRAGRAVAEAAEAMAVRGPVLVIAGGGNNGGDGFVAAADLAARGREVAVMLLGDRAALKGDAAIAAAEWTGALLPCDPAAIGQPVLIVDALFGAGLDRPLTGAAAAIVVAMNASGVPILSVDLPSGISGDTGAVMGVAVQAAATVTFFRRKPGHLLLPGRLYCGDTDVADIGIADDVLEAIGPRLFENVPELWADTFPEPQIDGHKYARGHAVVISGPMTATGAARLSARAALRAGAGLVTLASPPDALAVNASALTAVMLREVAGADQFATMLADKRLNACVIGPGAGVGERTRGLVGAALAARCRLVLDADALTSFATDPQTLFTGIAAQDQPQIVLTPHDGEFARVFGDIAHGAPSKVERARQAAARSGAVVLLKGADTVIAAPDGRAAITANAPPWLATAGSGDVLAGIICGLLAQGVAAFDAACMAAWMHGEAGHAFGPGLIAEDLPEQLPAVLRHLCDELGIAY